MKDGSKEVKKQEAKKFCARIRMVRGVELADRFGKRSLQKMVGRRPEASATTE